MRLFSLLIIFFITFALQSCLVTRTTIGDGPIGRRGKTDTYSKARRFYIFAGLLPLGLGQPAIPEHKNCQVKTYFGGVDVFVSFITFGIITSRSTKILVYEDQNPRRQSYRDNNNNNNTNAAKVEPTPQQENSNSEPPKEKKPLKLKNPFKKS